MPYSNMTFTVSTGLAFVVNDFVQVSHDADNYIIGRVVSYNSGTGVLVITPYDYKGSGSYSSWTVSLTGYNGTAATSGASSVSDSSGTAGTSATSATAGTAGESNSSGTSGVIGSSGNSATSGLSQPTATSGTSGASEVSGTSGTSGTSATSGVSTISTTSGTSGTNGSSATSGSSGNSGSSGSSATSGSSGLSRASGTSGGTGPAGSPGPGGGPGPTGGPGPAGSPGPPGPSGPVGSPGGPGPTGSPGSPGTTYYPNTNLNDYDNVTFPRVSVSGQATVNYLSLNAYSGTTPYTYFYSSSSGGYEWTSTVGGNNFYTVTTTVGASNFNAYSSRKLKKNIEPFIDSALYIINSIDIVTFNYELDGQEDSTRIGFIAEDTCEELATKRHDKFDTVSSLGVLIKSLQELDAKVTEKEKLYGIK